MSQFFKNMQNTASGLLKKFGTKITIRRTVNGVYNPATGRSGGDTVIEWYPVALKTNISKEFLSEYTSNGIAKGGTRIEAGDMMLLVDCKGHAEIPQVGDRVEFDNGQVWQIVEDAPVDPAGVVVLYKGVIRRG